jgi:hypothetical protein
VQQRRGNTNLNTPPLSSLHFIHALGVSCRCSGLLANASSLRVHCPAARRSSTIRAPCRHHRRRGRMVGAVLAVELGTIVFVRSAPASTAPSSSSTSPGKSANFCIPHSRLWDGEDLTAAAGARVQELVRSAAACWERRAVRVLAAASTPRVHTL